MIIVRHRRNSRVELEATPAELGIEVDIRSQGDRLIIHHDPFSDGQRFDEWLEAYRHRLLILNVKEEGLEDRLLDLMSRHGIEDFFFLDQSFPFLIRTGRRGERRCAVRVSEYESVETALAVAPLIDWVWVDCFSRFPLGGDAARRLQEAGLKLCLVSPELQGREGAREIPTLRALLEREGIRAEAVCTKEPALWA